MQRTAAFLLSALLASAAFAVPATVAYQGRLLNEQDQPVDGPIKITLRFFAERVPGDGETVLHTETFETRAAKGLFSLELGKQGFPAGLFDRPDVWIEAQLDGAPALTPRMRLVSAPFALKAASAVNADTAKVADQAKALTQDAKVPGAQVDGAVALATLADEAKALTASALVPAAQVDGKVAAALSADAAKALTQDAKVPAAQIEGKVAAAAAADTVGGKSYDDLKGEFALKSHEHSAAELTSGVLDVARIANGSITKEKIAPGAIEGSAFTPAGGIAANTISGALKELDAEKASLSALPTSPNYLQDSRHFRRLALTAAKAEATETYVDLANVGAPWEWRRYANETGNGNIGTAQVRRTRYEAFLTKPGDFAEFGSPVSLASHLGNSPDRPGYNDFSIVDFKIDVTGTGTGSYTAAYVRQGCQRYNGAYGAKLPATTSALVKIIQLGTNQSVRVAANGWPSQRHTAVSSSWIPMVAHADEAGGCLDLFAIDCDGACTGTVRFAIALPYISAGKRTGFSWAGYSHFPMDDMPRRTLCTVPTNTPNANSTNTYRFKPVDCTNGLPTGDCQTYMRKASACGSDEDWLAYGPEESGGAGMSWWIGNSNACAGVYAQAEYVCY